MLSFRYGTCALFMYVCTLFLHVFLSHILGHKVYKLTRKCVKFEIVKKRIQNGNLWVSYGVCLSGSVFVFVSSFMKIRPLNMFMAPKVNKSGRWSEKKYYNSFTILSILRRTGFNLVEVVPLGIPKCMLSVS